MRYKYSGVGYLITIRRDGVTYRLLTNGNVTRTDARGSAVISSGIMPDGNQFYRIAGLGR